VKVLQKAMGHSDIRLTLDTYGGLFGDDPDALAESMDGSRIPKGFSREWFLSGSFAVHCGLLIQHL